MNRAWIRRLLVVAAVTIGVVVTAQPVASTLLHDRSVRAAAREYDDRTVRAPSAELTRELDRARAYDASLSPSLLDDPWGDRPGSVDGPAHDAYLRQLASSPVMARLRIPSIDVDLPIRHDADDASLASGVGHMYGTALPVGGAGTHAVLAGHTGYRGTTFFDRLPELPRGAKFTIGVAGRTLTYRVEATVVVPPDRLSAVHPVAGRDLVTLVTCYTPPGENKQRLLVRGARVPDAGPTPGPSDRTEPAAPAPVQPWMWPRLLIAGAGLLVLLLLAARGFARRRERP